jgi:hypothetical protein
VVRPVLLDSSVLFPNVLRDISSLTDLPELVRTHNRTAS